MTRLRVGAVLFVEIELDSHAAPAAGFGQTRLEVSLTTHRHLITIRVQILDAKLALELLFKLTTQRSEGGRSGQANRVPVSAEGALEGNTFEAI